jgi:hypothetical protein
MMMQMLEAGGVPPVTDHIRKPDDDNPRGYYEFERVKKIKEDTDWLDDCSDRVVKMVSMLLYDLPPDKQYKVIFMKRDMAEMLASQNKMLLRLGTGEAGVSDEMITNTFTKHLEDIETWLEEQPNIQVIYVNHHDVIKNPKETAGKVNAFLDGRLDEKMTAGVVDRKLYRQRRQ